MASLTISSVTEAVEQAVDSPVDVLSAARCHPTLLALLLRHGARVYGRERSAEMPPAVYAHWTDQVNETNSD